MPTPVGHSLMGYILYFYKRKLGLKLNWKDMLLFLFLANMADLDYLPGFFVGNPNKFHHGMTHSITFAVLAGLIFGFIYHVKEKGGFLKYFSIFSLVYFSHLIMDFLGKDTRYPFGEQLFWPILRIYVLSPVAIFSDIHKASSSDVFVQSLFNWHNLCTLILECLIFSPVYIVIYFMVKRKRN